MSRSKQEIELLKKALEDKMNWGPVRSWHSKLFEQLSEAIFENTHVSLSVATLKRFFGVVKHEGIPSITTLDTLSKFLGDDSWTAFKLKRSRKTRLKSPGKTTYVTLGFILAIVTVALLSNRRPELIINSSEFEFSSKVLSKEFPNSVVFEFSIPENLRADSFKIQQYWDPTKTITIQQNQTEATGIYYSPGYFEARLLVDGQIAKVHDLFLKSEGWLGMIEYESFPKYFAPSLSEGISFPKNIMDEITTQSKAVTSSFHFVDELGDISGDNFTFSTTIKNSFNDQWAVCQALRIYFLGSSGAFIIPFSKIGCSSENNLMLNDQYLRGKEHNLSALSCNFSNATQLQIEVKEKMVSVFIDRELVYSKSYNLSMGRLVGLRYKFIGAGQVIRHELLDDNGNKILL